MKKLAPFFSTEARSVLKDIYLYSKKEWGALKAKSYTDRINEAVERLCVNPALGHIRHDIPAFMRVYAIGSHFIIYRTNQKTLVVVTILHQCMDFTPRLLSLLKKQPNL